MVRFRAWFREAVLYTWTLLCCLTELIFYTVVDVTNLLAIYHTLRCRLFWRFHFFLRESNSFICFSYFAVVSPATSINESESDSERRSVVSDSLQPYGLYSSRNSPGQNTGVGSLSLLQGIFPTQGLNPCLPHCRWILYQLSHKRRPRILKWVSYPFSSGSSQPRNWTRVSCIAGGFFTNWAIREALKNKEKEEIGVWPWRETWW